MTRAWKRAGWLGSLSFVALFCSCHRVLPYEMDRARSPDASVDVPQPADVVMAEVSELAAEGPVVDAGDEGGCLFFLFEEDLSDLQPARGRWRWTEPGHVLQEDLQMKGAHALLGGTEATLPPYVAITTVRIGEVSTDVDGSGAGLSVVLQPGETEQDPYRQFGCGLLFHDQTWYVSPYLCEGDPDCSTQDAEQPAPFVEVNRLYVVTMKVETDGTIECILQDTIGTMVSANLVVGPFIGAAQPQGVALVTFRAAATFQEPAFCVGPGS